MPDINNQTALGVQTPKPQTTTDIVAPITSLANLSYMSANTDRVRAETAGLEQSAALTRGKNQARQNFNSFHAAGMPVAEALDRSGLASWDPPSGKAILDNEGTARTLSANAAYAKAHPNEPLAIGGPELVGKDVTNKSVAATTADTNVKVTQQQMQLYGQVGNIMTAQGGATPEGRAVAADTARRAGIPEAIVQQYIHLPDDQYVAAGKHLQVAAISPEKYYDVSGQAEYNKGIAKAATTNDKLSTGEIPNRGPATYAVMHGQPVPPMPEAGSPSGQPGLSNPSPGAPAPANAGAPPAPPSLSSFGQPPLPSTLEPPNSAPRQAGPPAAAPAPAAAAPVVRNAKAVAVPSVGVNIPPEIAAAAKKYGIDPEMLGRTYQIESGGNPNAYNAQSKAAGPFQFVPSTGAKYVPNGKVFDLASSAEGAAHLASDNKNILTQALGREPTNAELYLAHQQGGAGAAKLLANPTVRAGDLVGNSAIAANGGNPNQPASAFTSLWNTKFNGGVGKSLPTGSFSPTVTATAPLASPNVAPGAVVPLAQALQPTPAPLPAPQAPTLQAAPAPVAPAQNQTPVQPVTSAAPPATGLAADNTKSLLPQGYQPVDAGPSKSAMAEQEQQGAAYGKLPEELDKAATAAKTTNTTLDEMSTAAQNFRLGKWSDHEQSLRESLQAVATSLGVKNQGLEQATGSYQDLAKLSGQVVRQAAHELGSRTGVQELQMITKTNPNAEMTEEGFNTAVAQMKGLGDFSIAKQQASANWKAANGNSLGPNKSGKDFQSTWNANASPAAFVMHRMEQENPRGVDNLISTLQKTPEGRAALKNITAQSHWAESNGLFGQQ